MKRSKSIEARRKKAIDEKAALLKNIEKHEPLKLVSLPYSAGPLLSLSDGKVVCFIVFLTRRSLTPEPLNDLLISSFPMCHRRQII